MAQEVDWDEVAPPAKGEGGGRKSNKGKFMRLEANQTYRVRPLRKPVTFWKYGNKKDGRYRSAIVEDPNNCPLTEKYPKLRAQKRYAILVFNRDEENILQVLEGPQKMFEALRHFKKVTKNEPGGPKGGDFQIKVVCPNGIKDRETTYDVEFLDPAPFTDDEKQYYKEHAEDFSLEEIFAAKDLEEIEEILFGEGYKRRDDDDDASADAVTTTSSSSKSGGDDDDPLNF